MDWSRFNREEGTLSDDENNYVVSRLLEGLECLMRGVKEGEIHQRDLFEVLYEVIFRSLSRPSDARWEPVDMSESMKKEPKNIISRREENLTECLESHRVLVQQEIQRIQQASGLAAL